MAFFNRIKLPDIPLHGTDTTVAWDKAGITESANKTPVGGTFIRHINVRLDHKVFRRTPSPKTVKRLLELTTELHEEITTEIGTDVVAHRYGIYRHASPDSGEYVWSNHQERILLPPGYSFVAEVEVIKPALQLHDRVAGDIEDSIGEFYSRQKRKRILPWDFNSEQFVTTDKDNHALRPIFVDVEPRLCYFAPYNT